MHVCLVSSGELLSNLAVMLQDRGTDDKLASPEASSQLDAANMEQWDLKRSLFDNHVSDSFDDNLKYMYKQFGFFFPDVEYLSDPEGLLRCARWSVRMPRQPPLSESCPGHGLDIRGQAASGGKASEWQCVEARTKCRCQLRRCCTSPPALKSTSAQLWSASLLLLFPPCHVCPPWQGMTEP
jgi:C2H2 type zinc-finger (2 copies)